MNKLKSEDLLELQAAEKLCDYPWTFEANKKNESSGKNWLIGSLGADINDNKNYFVTTDCVHASELQGTAKEDSNFIVLSRNMMPALLREVALMMRLKAFAKYPDKNQGDRLIIKDIRESVAEDVNLGSTELFGVKKTEGPGGLKNAN